MEQPNKAPEFPKKPTLKQIELQSSETKQINHFLKLHNHGKLTQKMVKKWLDKLPETDREKYKFELESGLVEDVNNLPE